MDVNSKLMRFGPPQGSLWKALLAPVRPRRNAARPSAPPAPEADAEWLDPAAGDPALAAAAVTALLRATFTGAGH
jgi:hypothetical protein